MKTFPQFILVFFGIMVIGCAGPKITQDFDPSIDFSRLKTYHWRTHEDKKPESSLVDERLHTAVDNSLAEKGYQRIYNGKGDFSVSYQYRVMKNHSSPNLHTGVRHRRRQRRGFRRHRHRCFRPRRQRGRGNADHQHLGHFFRKADLAGEQHPAHFAVRQHDDDRCT